MASEPIPIFVSTAPIGSSYLDKKRRLTLPFNSTISYLKEQLAVRFPGSPPIALQRIFYGTRLLSDDVLINNLTSVTPIPLTLDMITGTSVYNRTMTITQALEAYVSLIVQQAYVSSSFGKVYGPNSQQIDTEDSISTEGEDGEGKVDILQTKIY